jgi:hypothetical protein
MSPHNELHRLAEWAGCIPFLLLTVHDGKMRVGLDLSRIIETIVIAAVLGGITMYVTTSVLEVKLEGVQAEVREVKQKVDQIYRDIYRPSIPGHGGG